MVLAESVNLEAIRGGRGSELASREMDIHPSNPTVQGRVLLVDDDPIFRSLLEHILVTQGYQVLSAGCAAEMLRQVGSCDLILLDLNLPDEDGLVLLRRFRPQWEAAVIVVTSREDSENRLAALELGADDILIKPFVPQELLLRINGLLVRQMNRTGRLDAPDADRSATDSVLPFGDWTLDLRQRQVLNPSGVELRLSRGEFELLRTLVVARGGVVTRADLADRLPSRGDPNPNTVTVLMHRLRQKLSQGADNSVVLETVSGIGYRLRTTDAAAPAA